MLSLSLTKDVVYGDGWGTGVLSLSLTKNVVYGYGWETGLLSWDLTAEVMYVWFGIRIDGEKGVKFELNEGCGVWG